MPIFNDTETMNIWEYVEYNSVRSLAPVARLYSWTTNYSTGEGPFTAFMDLIGWSQEELGESLYNWKEPKLGYLELDMLADALKYYANSPSDVYDFVNKIIELELGE